MANRTQEEIELLKKLNISSFRELKAEHALELASSLKELPVEIQKQIIAQIPNFTSTYLSALSTIHSSMQEIIKTDTDEVNKCFNTYDEIIYSLKELLNKNDNLTFDQQMIIIDKMSEIQNMKTNMHFEEEQTRDRKFHNFLACSLIGFLGILSAIGVGVSLGKNNSKEEPNNDEE